MADADVAIDYLLGWEDATLSGVITVDDGGRTRFGLAEKFHPELANSLYFSSMGQVAALAIARATYEIQYCEPLCIADIVDQRIANKLLSLGVNVGKVPAAKMLQDALLVPGDGHIGPITLNRLEDSNPDEVLDHLREEAENHYLALVEKHPEKRKWLNGWMRRAKA